MVHGFISQSGGRVTIDSQPGRGTCVTMYLPVADTAASRTTTALPAENEEPRPTSNAVDKSETILVVEDDADLRDLVERSL
ncbi:MAG: hybrid sensor histidine kinase/response regulator, partial [Alphaproteobacteria bacterium]